MGIVMDFTKMYSGLMFRMKQFVAILSAIGHVCIEITYINMVPFDEYKPNLKTLALYVNFVIQK
jgi:hypothetical protein